jgi:hypothetical protein
MKNYKYFKTTNHYPIHALEAVEKAYYVQNVDHEEMVHYHSLKVVLVDIATIF